MERLCESCGEMKEHRARGLCSRCYNRTYMRKYYKRLRERVQELERKLSKYEEQS